VRLGSPGPILEDLLDISRIGSAKLRLEKKEARLETVIEAAVEILVRDNGVGISPEFLPRIFDLFSQADSTTTSDKGGLGLGLALVRQLTRLHGGRVAAESPGMGQGAVFKVILPLPGPRPAVVRREAVDQRPDAETAGAPRLDELRGLVVDDVTTFPAEPQHHENALPNAGERQEARQPLAGVRRGAHDFREEEAAEPRMDFVGGGPKA
jgi:hypothetical protein